MRTLVYVLYDSVCNSVFSGQVVTPLAKSVAEGKYNFVNIVSFEPKSVNPSILATITRVHERVQVTILPRWPFLHKFLLKRDIKKLKVLLKRFEHYDLIARGPLAGYIAFCARDLSCQSFVIQARGLLAQEYYHAHPNYCMATPFHCWRVHSYELIEKFVYGRCTCTIEAVSPALEKYLVDNYSAQPEHIRIACDDIPPRLEPRVIAHWRAQMRHELGMSPDMRVYCVCASRQPWQEPHLVASFFKQRMQCEPRSCLLVLTSDVGAYEQALKIAGVAPHIARVLQVKHEQVYCYLSAADVGLVLREHGLASWVARPVKAMEYEAVGLEIVHNNSVDWMIARYGVCRAWE